VTLSWTLPGVRKSRISKKLFLHSLKSNQSKKHPFNHWWAPSYNKRSLNWSLQKAKAKAQGILPPKIA